MAPPSSSLLRDLLAMDGFKNRRKPPDNSGAPAASRAVSMPHEQRRPGKPARSQSDVRAHSRLRDGGAAGRPDDGGRDARAATATATTTRRSSASLASARRGGSPASAAVPALDESALSALISLAAGAVKPFAKDDAFRASLRTGCAACLGDSDHRAVLDLRVLAQTVERAAARDGPPDPRDLKRASLRLHEIAEPTLDGKDAADAVTATAGALYPRLAACAHLYMSVASGLQRKDHSAAVHALEAFCLAPREARTALLPALWDRLLRPGLSHLRAWRDRETAAASSDERTKEVEKTFMDAVDDGTRTLACYYRDWLLGRSSAMALPDVPAPPSTVHASSSATTRCSTSTSYDVGSDVVFSSGTPSPARFLHLDTMRRSEEADEEEEEDVHVKMADAETVVHECDDDGEEARSVAPTLLLSEQENVVLMPIKLAKEAFETQVKGSDGSTIYHPLTSDISAIDLLTLEFCKEPVQSDADSTPFSIYATVPSDFLCPLTRQIFVHPVTIETGQTFERHAIVQWLDRGFRTCPVTEQELESSSVPDINRVLKRLIHNWKSDYCKITISDTTGVEEKLTVSVIDRVLGSACDMAEKFDKARHFMAIGGIDFLLRKFQGGEGDEKAWAAEKLLLCVTAEGSCRNYVAVRIDGSSVLRLLHSEMPSAKRTAVCLLVELICLRRREMFELMLRGLGKELILEAMDVLLEHLRSLPVGQKAPVAVLLLHFDALVELHGNSMYREESAKIITNSLRCCLSDDDVVPSTRRALLLLAGRFSFSGDLLAEDWMLKQAGFVEDSPAATAIDSEAAVQVMKETAANEAWLRHATAALLGGGVRRPFLEALCRCMGSPNDSGDLTAACLTTAGWLSRALASAPLDDAADMQLAAFSALIPRLKQCLAADRPARHRVLAAVALHNFSKIPDCRVLLMLLSDGLRDHLAELAELTWTAGQLAAELQE